MDLRGSFPLDALLHLEGYCAVPTCMAREVTIYVKNYDGDPIPDLKCPLCGATLARPHVLTSTEYVAREKRQARTSVNVQMYVRDHTEPGGLVIYPASAMRREDLPPTPPGWWEKQP